MDHRFPERVSDIPIAIKGNLVANIIDYASPDPQKMVNVTWINNCQYQCSSNNYKLFTKTKCSMCNVQ